MISSALIWKAMAIAAFGAVAALLGTILMGIEPRGTDLGSSVRDVFAVWNHNRKIAEELWQTGVRGRQVAEAAYLEARDEQANTLPLVLLGILAVANVFAIWRLMPLHLDWIAIPGALAVIAALYYTAKFYTYAMITAAINIVISPLLNHWSTATIADREPSKEASSPPPATREPLEMDEHMHGLLRVDQRFVHYVREYGEREFANMNKRNTFRLSKRSFIFAFAALLFFPVWLPNIAVMGFTFYDFDQFSRLLSEVPNLSNWFRGWFVCTAVYAVLLMSFTRWQRERALFTAAILLSSANRSFGTYMASMVLDDPDANRPEEDQKLADDLYDMRSII